MNLKRGPFVLLILLIIILIFILGVRYGQKVEKTNKVINYLISLPPTQPPPTQKPVEFNKYSNSVCSIEFLYPSYLKKENESSSSAEFSSYNSIIRLDCFSQFQMPFMTEKINTATAEIEFKGKKIQASIKSENNLETYFFQIKNPINVKTIYVKISKSLYPLFENSLKFLP